MKKTLFYVLLSALLAVAALTQYRIQSADASDLSDTAVAGQNLSPEQEKQAQALSAHLIINDKFVDRFLEKVKFSPPASLGNAWKFYPDYRKVLVATAMAESVHPNRGADRFLAMLAYALAQRGDPISHEPALAQLRSSPHYSAPAHVDFGELVTDAPASSLLSLEHVKAIRALSSFLESGSLGTPQSIMVHYVGLTFDQAFALLEKSASTSDALESALANLDLDRRHEALVAITRDAGRINPALKYEDALIALMGPGRRGGPDEGPGPGFRPTSPKPSPGGGGGAGGFGSNPSESEVRKSFLELYQRSYGTEKSRGFGSMQENENGFGGIIFGNVVTKSGGLPRIEALQYQQSNQALKLTFEGGAHAKLSNVTFDEALAAFRLIYPSGSKGWVAVRGIGLTGLAYDCRSGFARVRQDEATEDHLRVILNPVLWNSRLGWSAIAADERATFASAVFKGVERQMGTEFPSDSKADVQRLINRTFLPLRHASWKITDVPLEMSVDSQSEVHFVRTDGVDEFPLGLRRIGYIQMTFYSDKLPATLSVQFYHLFPMLMQAFPEYRQINHFASVLAITRLAKMDGAGFAEPQGTPNAAVPTPEYVAYKNGIIMTDPTPICRQMSTEEKQRQDALQKLLEQLKQNK